MARSLKLRDNFGGFVDYSSGMLIVAFLPFCLGIGAYRHAEGSAAALTQSLSLDVTWPAVAFLIMGGVISILSLFMRLINRVLQIRSGEALTEAEDKPKGGSGDGPQ